MATKIKLFEAFAGYGGANFALKKSGIKNKTIGFSENDKFAIKIYELNHPKVKNYGDITAIKHEELPDFNFFTGGFPCQPFSQAGDGLGINDTRGTIQYRTKVAGVLAKRAVQIAKDRIIRNS